MFLFLDVLGHERAHRIVHHIGLRTTASERDTTLLPKILRQLVHGSLNYKVFSLHFSRQRGASLLTLARQRTSLQT